MLSRWKLMAGVLGISIGGLAAAASQCPKWDKSKGRQPEKSSTKADTDVKLPPAGPPSTPMIPLPDVPPTPSSPKAPQLVPAGPTPPPIALDAGTPTAPPLPTPNAVLPTPSALPPVPDFPASPPAPEKSATKPTDAKPSGALPPLPVIPTSGTAPAGKPIEPKPPGSPIPAPDAPAKSTAPSLPGTPMPLVTPAAPTGIELTPPPSVGITPPGKPVAVPPVVGVGATQPSNPTAVPPVFGPPPSTGPGLPPAPADPLPSVNVPPSKPTPAPAQAPVGATPFRILLRVGEGEPTFEVKNGDNLVLKVACEKVDIKSPEKGAGMSEVIAHGKVRFAGFGAEGTCDELKFFAGTGEVSMTGDVKVQVKDKLGRVESELTSGSLKYKIDASAVGGQIKP